MSTHLTRLPQTDYGMPLLDDMTTNDEWWSIGEASDARPNVILAVTEPDGPAWPERPQVKGIREPDLYDEGCAIWLTDRAVVYTGIGAMERLPNILLADRVRWLPEGLGFTRLHPSHYGVQVDSYFTHNGEPAPHTAHEAWDLLAEAVSA